MAYKFLNECKVIEAHMFEVESHVKEVKMNRAFQEVNWSFKVAGMCNWEKEAWEEIISVWELF